MLAVAAAVVFAALIGRTAAAAPPPDSGSLLLEPVNVQLTLRSARRAIDDESTVQRIQRRLAPVEQDVSEWGLQPVELWRLPRRELSELHTQWTELQTDLGVWQRELDDRETRLQTKRKKLEELRERSASGGLAAADAQDRSEGKASADAGVLAQAAELDALAATRLDALSSLQHQVAAESSKVAQIVSDVEDARAHLTATTMDRVAPPLWQLAAARAEGSLGGDATQVFAARRRAWTTFLADRQSALASLVVLTAAIAAILWTLRRKHVGTHLPPEAMRLSEHLLSRPASAAILLTVLTAPLTLSPAPPGFIRVLTLLLLIPLLRLLLPLVPSHVRPLLYGLAGLIVLDHVKGLFAHQIFAHRILLLVEAFLAACAVWLWAVRERKATGSGLRTAVTGGAAAFAVSVLANITGYVPLADVIVSGLRVSAYVGVVMYAGTMVLDVVFIVALHSRPAERLRMIQRHRDAIHRRMYRAMALAALVLWVLAALRGFGVFQPVLGAVRGILDRGFQVGSVTVSLSRILLVGAVLWVSSAVSRTLRFLLDEEVFPRTGLVRGKAGALSRIVGYAVFGCGFIIAMGVAGIDATQITVLAGALGVGIGFGLQNIVSNFVAGIILILERPVNIGDYIEVDKLVGEVQRIGVRSSTVRALDGAEVIVPNERLISNQVVNWTLSDRSRRIDIPVGVAYGTPPERVLQLLEQAAGQQPGVLAKPRPMALFRGFGDSALDFELLIWVADFADWRRIRSEVGVRMHAALTGAGIEIPYPQRDLHVRSVDEKVLGKLGPPGAGK